MNIMILAPLLYARPTYVQLYGDEVLDLAILALKPTPEMSKALEAAAREETLRQADAAVYARRNAGVEQERKIKEKAPLFQWADCLYRSRFNRLA